MINSSNLFSHKEQLSCFIPIIPLALTVEHSRLPFSAIFLQRFFILF